MRVQIPYRVSISRTRIRLPEILGDRRKDQQDQVVPKAERISLSPFHERQDHKAMEGVREVFKSGGRE